jgi:hypothetical protein
LTSGDSLEVYYRNAYTLCHLRNFCSLTEYENMIPYEIDVYVAMMMAKEQQETDEIKAMESIQNKLNSDGVDPSLFHD